MTIGPAVLRRALGDPEILVAPGVYDGLSAKVAEQAGFRAVYASGGAVARSSGVPDLGLLSMTEVLRRVREVVDAVSVPVIADADTGFGNVLNVARTVHELERLGVAALHIEDQVTPKKCGHYADKKLVPVGTMLGKLRAAQSARTDPGPLLIARTDAIAVEGFNQALERARCYAEAGADLVFVEAPTSREELARIPSEMAVPVVVNMFAGGRTPLVGTAELEEWGYAMMLVPSDLQRAALRAMQEAAEVLRADGSTAALTDRLASFDERDEVVGLGAYQHLATRLDSGA